MNKITPPFQDDAGAISANKSILKFCQRHPRYWVSRRETVCFLWPTSVVRECPACESEAYLCSPSQLELIQRTADQNVSIESNAVKRRRYLATVEAELRRSMEVELRLQVALEEVMHEATVELRNWAGKLVFKQAQYDEMLQYSQTGVYFGTNVGDIFAMPDGRSLLVADCGHGIAVISTATGAHLGYKEGNCSGRGVAFSPIRGELYISDVGSHCVRVSRLATGTYLRSIGSGGRAHGQLSDPVGVVLSPDGSELYVAEFGNARISVFDAVSGLFIRCLGTNRKGPYKLRGPTFCAISPSGHTLFVSDFKSRQVFSLDARSGTVLRTFVFDTERPFIPRGLAVSPSGVLLFVVSGQLVLAFSAQHGSLVAEWDVGNALLEPTGLALSSDGRNLFVADAAGMLHKID
jgi:hypothetical protein